MPDSLSETPAAAGFCMPAEWEAHDACWMGWPCRAEAFGGAADLQAACRAYALVARSIAEFEPVFMIARPQDAADARKALGDAAQVLEWPMDDSWLRDSGPTFLRDAAGSIAGVDWRFNAWGEKYRPFDQDNALAARVLEHAGARRFPAPLVMEGGSFHCDGEGTALTTEQCLLHPNRNPGMSREQIEQALQDYLGVQKIIWLRGDPLDEETDGHVDEVACFAAPGVALAMHAPDEPALDENVRRLQAASDACGRRLEVILLPRPRVFRRGAHCPASYINFYLANGAAVIPSYGVPEDAEAKSILTDAFPGRRIVQLPAAAIAFGGGGIHCITQQQPARAQIAPQV